MLPQASPQQAFVSLFTGFMPANAADAGKVALELRKRKSVLDTVDRSFAGVLPSMGQWDRQRLQRHYDEVRALEKLLATPAPMMGGACELPADPGADRRWAAISDRWDGAAAVATARRINVRMPSPSWCTWRSSAISPARSR